MFVLLFCRYVLRGFYYTMLRASCNFAKPTFCQWDARGRCCNGVEVYQRFAPPKTFLLLGRKFRIHYYGPDLLILLSIVSCTLKEELEQYHLLSRYGAPSIFFIPEAPERRIVCLSSTTYAVHSTYRSRLL